MWVEQFEKFNGALKDPDYFLPIFCKERWERVMRNGWL
jgi:hypothetical protein